MALLLAGALPLGAQQSPPSPSALPAQPPAPRQTLRDYVIGPQDLLLVTILESPELSREVRVGADGKVGLPLLDAVLVQGLTLTEAERLLEVKYREAGILNQPNITLTVKELQSKPVTVMGAVRNPGVFQISGQSRLLRVLSQAGGVSDEAGGAIQVIRAALANEPVLRVPLGEVQAGALEADVPVYGGDIVNVLPAGAVYVVGAVNRPGRHLLRGDADQATVLRVIALAEDFKRSAKPGKSVLIRKDRVTGALQQIPVDIRKILQRRQPDPPVLANDVLFVPESVGKRAMARGVEAALQVAAGILIISAPR